MHAQAAKRLFPFSWRDFLVSAGILLCAMGLCLLLRLVDDSGEFATLIFVLAVLLISRLTSGYLFGLVSSLLGVVGVNYIFTYPYLEINFSIAGYPLTFLTMLGVSIITCAMTTQIKQQEHLRLENEKEKMRANLLRSVSHDIRTPLTSIMGATTAVLEETGLSEPEKRALLQDARADAQWLIRVVENLLSVTRIGDGQAHISKEPEAAEEILAAAARKFRKRFPTIRITVEAPEDLLLVPMDAILIEQVLANLLENAVLHGARTTAVGLRVSTDGAYARFCVRDNGKGIPPALLPVLFEGNFQPSEDSVQDGKRNMGLGLMVCTAIVRAHDGTIGASNLSGGGAEIFFCLPLNEEETV